MNYNTSNNTGEMKMRKWNTLVIILVSFMIVYSTISCGEGGGGENIYIPPYTTTTTTTTTTIMASAKIELYDGYQKGYTSYNRPKINGRVINNGDATGYNTMVTVYAYSGNTLVATAVGFPADLGDIPVGAIVDFEAVFFDLQSHNQYDRASAEVEFLTRRY